jgi:hypothetical protein
MPSYRFRFAARPGDAWSLEGSRFVALQLYRLAAGGSRERVDVRQFYRAVVSLQQNRRDGQNVELSHSREPPASNR